MNKVSTKEQQERQNVHKMLSRLIAEYVEKTGVFINEVTVLDLIKWSYERLKSENNGK